MMQPKGATARGGAVERSETEGEYLMALLLRAIPLSSRLAPRHFPRTRGQLLVQIYKLIFGFPKAPPLAGELAIRRKAY